MATYRDWIIQAGLHVESEEFVPEGDSGHQLFWAHRRAGLEACVIAPVSPGTAPVIPPVHYRRLPGMARRPARTNGSSVVTSLLTA